MNDWEKLMIVLAIMLMVAVVGILWNLHRGKDHHASVCAVIALVYLAFFAWAQNKAEGEHELKHAAEHRAVQEQVESIQHF